MQTNPVVAALQQQVDQIQKTLTGLVANPGGEQTDPTSPQVAYYISQNLRAPLQNTLQSLLRTLSTDTAFQQACRQSLASPHNPFFDVSETLNVRAPAIARQITPAVVQVIVALLPAILLAAQAQQQSSADNGQRSNTYRGENVNPAGDWSQRSN